MEATDLKQEAQFNGRSLYIALSKDVLVNGKVVRIRGEIKSLQPPCQEEALSYGKHPFTCENCFRQLRDLKDIIQHQKSGSLYTKTNQLRFLRSEAVDTSEIETPERKQSEAKMKQLVRAMLTPKEWEDSLHDAFLNGEDQRLVIRLVRLLRMGVSECSPMQMLVIQNLVSKLQKAKNRD